MPRKKTTFGSLTPQASTARAIRSVSAKAHAQCGGRGQPISEKVPCLVEAATDLLVESVKVRHSRRGAERIRDREKLLRTTAGLLRTAGALASRHRESDRLLPIVQESWEGAVEEAQHLFRQTGRDPKGARVWINTLRSGSPNARFWGRKWLPEA
jgi:hypothetical protein